MALFFIFLYFQYDQFKTPMENIGLQDSLLSRFDLLFIVLDKVVLLLTLLNKCYVFVNTNFVLLISIMQ